MRETINKLRNENRKDVMELSNNSKRMNEIIDRKMVIQRMIGVAIAPWDMVRNNEYDTIVEMYKELTAEFNYLTAQEKVIINRISERERQIEEMELVS